MTAAVVQVLGRVVFVLGLVVVVDGAPVVEVVALFVVEVGASVVVGSTVGGEDHVVVVVPDGVVGTGGGVAAVVGGAGGRVVIGRLVLVGPVCVVLVVGPWPLVLTGNSLDFRPDVVTGVLRGGVVMVVGAATVKFVVTVLDEVGLAGTR